MILNIRRIGCGDEFMNAEDKAIIKEFNRQERKHLQLMIHRKECELNYYRLKLKSVTDELEQSEKDCCIPIQQ